MRPPHILALLLAVPGAIAWRHWAQGRQRGTNCGSCLGSALMGDLATLNDAVRVYRDDHGRYPTLLDFERQLCSYSNAEGKTSPAGDEAHPLGPYLRSIPVMPLGPERGRRTVGDHAMPRVAWIYDEATGEVRGNAPGDAIP